MLYYVHAHISVAMHYQNVTKLTVVHVFPKFAISMDLYLTVFPNFAISMDLYLTVFPNFALRIDLYLTCIVEETNPCMVSLLKKNVGMSGNKPALLVFSH